ncbi:MAG: F0F1 ATP synthase subunit A [Hirschia sp.]|nr:F0F1 ATP synthase subunit A [Hirschia sp.]MBF19819.1 F0F1 ATP synthase subunit A [Hirschia sp.]
MLEMINVMINQVATDPIHQFKLSKIVDWQIGGVDLSFTNSALFMAIGVGLAIVLFMMATSKIETVPGRSQSIAEIAYGFVAGMVRDMMGEEGMRFFPFVFSLFVFIFFANMLGMFPYFFTTTSHIIVNFALAMLVMAIVIGYGFYKNGFKFLKIFFPSGVPAALSPLVALIEFISFLSRPISLSVRLFANMLAGHIMLKVFAGFVFSLAATGSALAIIAPVALAGTVAVVALEFLVAFLQAYVFAILTCVYLNDALHPGH